MSQEQDKRVRRQILVGALIESPIVLGGAILAVVTQNPMWAIGAAALGTTVLFVLIAQAKREERR
jgi:hypothetical protein